MEQKKTFVVYKTADVVTLTPWMGANHLKWDRVAAVDVRKDAATLCGLLMQDGKATAVCIQQEFTD